jgi:peptide chain release factor 1
MLDKLRKIQKEFETLTERLSNPALAKDPKEFAKVAKKRSVLEPTVELTIAYDACLKTMEDSENMLKNESDPELLELAKLELHEAKTKKLALEEKIKEALIPKDPNDEKSVIVEIRAAAGGEEAALFGAQLSRAYMNYARDQGFRVEILSQSEADAGGIKELIFKIEGHGAYSKFKYESGTHRVQRVPVTENQGRVHTSTITVAVLPEAEEVDIKIEDKDLKIDVYRSSGPGGQSVNTTDSAVRITHIPSGLVVSCQNEKSQLKNKHKAMEILRSRILALEEEKAAKERGDQRLAQIGSGMRAEKIRTYNFPQDRVTDHRVHQNWSNLPSIMEGNMDRIVSDLTVADNARKLAEQHKN